MKTSEIMLGDYFNVYPSNMAIRVVAIHKGKVAYRAACTGKLEWVRADLLRPIPLTLNIFEKNNFYYGYTSNEEDLASNTIAQLSEDDMGWCWDEGDGAIKVIFPNETDGGLLIIDDQSFDRHFEMVFSKNLFLHELQHALRLCGICKTIEI